MILEEDTQRLNANEIRHGPSCCGNRTSEDLRCVLEAFSRSRRGCCQPPELMQHEITAVYGHRCSTFVPVPCFAKESTGLITGKVEGNKNQYHARHK